MRFMRWSETRCISSFVRPRGHATTSAITKSDFLVVPALTNSDTPPVPRPLRCQRRLRSPASGDTSYGFTCFKALYLITLARDFLSQLLPPL